MVLLHDIVQVGARADLDRVFPTVCYVIEGQINVTMFGSHGRFRAEDLEKADVAYFPKGYGHSIENMGDNPCRVLIGFKSGVYETIYLSQWIAGNPLDVLATNFSKPEALFEKFPQVDVFITDKSRT